MFDLDVLKFLDKEFLDSDDRSLLEKISRIFFTSDDVSV